MNGGATVSTPTEVAFHRETAKMIESASQTTLLSGPLTLIQSDVLSGRLKILRNGAAVELTPAFTEWFEKTFRALAAATLRSLQLFGMAVVVIAPPTPPSRRPRGVRALQRGDAQRRRQPDAPAPVGTPVCLPLTSDSVELTFTTFNGIREYTINADNFDDVVLDTAIVSVLDAPSEHGLPTTAVAGVLNEVFTESALQTVVLDVALEHARPLQFVQKRHGPSGPGGGSVIGGGAHGLGLFFDSESQAIVDETKEKEAKALVDQVKELNRLQTSVHEPLKVGNVQKEAEPPRIFQLHPDL
jgi:hypothetical protein